MIKIVISAAALMRLDPYIHKAVPNLALLNYVYYIVLGMTHTIEISWLTNNH